MKTTRIKHICVRLACIVALSGVMQGCLKDDTNTIILPPSMSQIPDAVLDKELVDMIRDYIDINEGDKAPKLHGKYLCSPMKLVHASDEYPNPNFYDIYMAFEGQNCRGMISYQEKQNKAHLSCPYAYVIGSDEKFTMALTQRMTNETHGWWCDVAIVVSGSFTPQGIRNLQYAIVMKDKYDPHEVLMETHGFRVYKDADGMSPKHSWTPQAGVNMTNLIGNNKGGVL